MLILLRRRVSADVPVLVSGVLADASADPELAVPLSSSPLTLFSQ